MHVHLGSDISSQVRTIGRRKSWFTWISDVPCSVSRRLLVITCLKRDFRSVEKKRAENRSYIPCLSVVAHALHRWLAAVRFSLYDDLLEHEKAGREMQRGIRLSLSFLRSIVSYSWDQCM
jgi:hypothetical protein